MQTAQKLYERGKGHGKGFEGDSSPLGLSNLVSLFSSVLYDLLMLLLNLLSHRRSHLFGNRLPL